MMDYLLEFLILHDQTLVLRLVVLDSGSVALYGRKRDWSVERIVESVEVVKQMGKFLLERWEFDEGKLLLLRLDVVDDLEVDLLQDDVQFIQNLFLHLIKYVLAHLHHLTVNYQYNFIEI